MIRHFLMLEWKSFFRSASLGSSIIIKIFAGLAALYFSLLFISGGILTYKLIKDVLHLDPLITVNKFLIYYFVLDLTIRFFFQKMPVLNIKPLLHLPISRNAIVNFTLGKTILSFFNLVHALFFIPFSIILVYKGHLPIQQVVCWHLGIIALVYCSNFINVLLNNKDSVFYPIAAVIVACALAQYYKFFDLTLITFPFFNYLYKMPFFFFIPFLIAGGLYYFSFNFFKNNLNLDEGLVTKSDVAVTENFAWLNQFGTLGTFLKNDIRLLKRNKRSKTTLFMSVLFIFYGLLFFTGGIKAYDNPAMKVFAGIFVSGGFLFTFGQFVPSWDSSYYQLMMSQNIKYKDYLSSKWWLMVIATVFSTLIASFYLYFGWHTYLLIIVGAIYNIGINSHLVLLAGAYVKTPIDLSQSKGAFGDKKAFNFKTVLLSLPKLAVPMALYALGYYLINPTAGLVFVATAGFLGFAFKNKMFTLIEKVYRTEKYATIAAYKQKN